MIGGINKLLNLDLYIKKIQDSKSPVKESLMIANVIGGEYLNAILNRSIEVANIKVAQAIFLSMKVYAMYQASLIEMENLEHESGKITK